MAGRPGHRREREPESPLLFRGRGPGAEHIGVQRDWPEAGDGGIEFDDARVLIGAVLDELVLRRDAEVVVERVAGVDLDGDGASQRAPDKLIREVRRVFLAESERDPG